MKTLENRLKEELTNLEYIHLNFSEYLRKGNNNLIICRCYGVTEDGSKGIVKCLKMLKRLKKASLEFFNGYSCLDDYRMMDGKENMAFCQKADPPSP